MKNILQKILKILIIFTIYFWTNQALAYISAPWTINSNTVWTTWNTYYVTSTVTITSGYTLTIQEWVVIKFSGSSAWIMVNGTLLVNWTDSSKVTFTSMNDNTIWETISWSNWSPTAWSWRDIYFDWAWANASVIDYAQIKYAWHASYESTNVYISSSNPTIRNSIISNGSTYWVYIFSWSPTIQNNTISNNSSYWLYIYWWSPSIQSNSINNNSTYWLYNYWWSATFLNNSFSWNTNIAYTYSIDPFLVSSNSSFGTNTSNKIVLTNIGNMLASSWTLKGYSNADYLISSTNTIASWKTINIWSWAVVKFSGSSAWIMVNWVLNTLGTNSNNVVFTSVNDNSVWQALGTWTPSAWSWRNIYFDWAWANSSIIDYAQIKYAWNATYESTNVYISSSNPTIRNSLISYSPTYWLYIFSWSPSIQSNSITNNASYWLYNYWWNASFLNNYYAWNALIIYSYNIDPFFISTNNSFWTNTSNKININSLGTMTASTWTIQGYSNVDYVISSTHTIASWKTINIWPGAIIKFSGSSAWIMVNWVLNTLGNTSNNVIFTSINDNSVWQVLGSWSPTAWSWRDIYFDWSWANASVIDYTQIKYAWNATYESTNVYISSSNPTIRNSIISNGSTYWVYIFSWSPTIQNSIFYNNANYWLYKYGWTPSYTYNLFYNSSSTTLNSNVSIDTNPAAWWNIINTNPLFVSPSTWNFRLQNSSPAINKWNPSLWNHIFSGDRYDIGTYEYAWYANLPFSANITGVSARNLTYTWSIIQDPTNGSNPPSITGPSWSISADWSVACSFQVTKLGSYSLKLEIKEWANVIWTSTNTFTVTGP